MENKQSSFAKIQILWREPFKCQWRRLPTFPPIWKMGTRRGLMFLCITYATSFMCAAIVDFVTPHFVTRPFLDAFLIVSIGWLLAISPFALGIVAYFIESAITPAKVGLVGNDLILYKSFARIPFSEITEARVTGDQNGVRSLTVSTAKISRTVWIPVGADLSELQKILGVRLVFDNGSPRNSNKKY